MDACRECAIAQVIALQKLSKRFLSVPKKTLECYLSIENRMPNVLGLILAYFLFKKLILIPLFSLYKENKTDYLLIISILR